VKTEKPNRNTLTETERYRAIDEAAKKQREANRGKPLNPDRDLSWDNTDFGDMKDD
jgi:hypothetical protein